MARPQRGLGGGRHPQPPVAIEVGGGDGFDIYARPRGLDAGYSDMPGRQSHALGPPHRRAARTSSRRDRSRRSGERLRFNWNTGLAIDPFEPGTIYYGSQYVHRSTDRGDSWTVISPDLTTNNPEWQQQATTGGLTPDVTGAENFTTHPRHRPEPGRSAA